MTLPGTINHQDAFLKSPPAGFDGVFDWSWTGGCFGNGLIKPMDIDGMVERRGQFLIFETKNVGVQIPQGQLITLKQLHSLRVFSVMIIHGKTLPELCSCWYPNSHHKAELHGVDEARAWVAKWYAWADRGAA